MARLTALPEIDIIRGFKGIIDFYLWKGLPCARAWPRWRPARQTDASLAAALLFGAIIKAFSLTHGAVLEQLALEAKTIPRTARDITVSGIYGNLHEASMTDFLDLLTECRDFLSNLQAILTALDSIDTDELVVNVDQSVLPPLAATTTHQTTMITALQKIDDLQDALESNALDRLLVRGMDQLFSYTDRYSERALVMGAGAGTQSVLATAVPPGQVWIVTGVSAYADVRAATRGYLTVVGPANTPAFFNTLALAISEAMNWSGHLFLKEGDRIRATWEGLLAGGWLYLFPHGHKMTLET